MTVTYTRAQLGALLDARHRAGAHEGTGAGAWMEFRFRITPDILYAIMGARIVFDDDSQGILTSVVVGDDGLVEPVLTRYTRTLGD